MAERNLTRAINNLLEARRRKLKPEERYRVELKLKEKMKKLFDKKLKKFEESYTEKELEQIRAFFEEHAKKLSVQRQKDPIPEDEDLIILLSTKKLEADRKAILSDDAHFTDYREEIFNEIAVEIIAMKDLMQEMKSWGWVK